MAVRFPAPYPAFSGSQLSVRGRNKKPQRFTVLWPGRLEAQELRQLSKISKKLLASHPHVTGIYRCILHLRGYVRIAPCIGKGVFPKTLFLVVSWLVPEDKLEILRRKILKIASKPGSANAKMMRVEDFSNALILAIAKKMRGTMNLQFCNGWFFKPGDLALTPLHLLRPVQEADTEGIRVSSLVGAAEETILDELSRIGLVRGGSQLWFSIEASEALSAMLLAIRIGVIEFQCFIRVRFSPEAETEHLGSCILWNQRGVFLSSPTGES